VVGGESEAGVFRKDRFLQPAVGFTLAFPAGWKHRNTPHYVMSVHPGQDALLMLGLAPGAPEPAAAGEQLVRQMRAKARLEPISTRSAAVGSFRPSW
jgi:predicted Zn-dependent protease